MKSLHGFAFASDLEAQAAERAGKMLTLASARGINAIVGQGYLETEKLLESDEQIRRFLMSGVAARGIRGEVEKFEFFLIYYNAISRLPIIGFRPKSGPGNDS
jgi:hypothetical protein